MAITDIDRYAHLTEADVEALVSRFVSWFSVELS